MQVTFQLLVTGPHTRESFYCLHFLGGPARIVEELKQVVGGGKLKKWYRIIFNLSSSQFDILSMFHCPLHGKMAS